MTQLSMYQHLLSAGGGTSGLALVQCRGECAEFMAALGGPMGTSCGLQPHEPVCRLAMATVHSGFRVQTSGSGVFDLRLCECSLPYHKACVAGQISCSK